MGPCILNSDFRLNFIKSVKTPIAAPFLPDLDLQISAGTTDLGRTYRTPPLISRASPQSLSRQKSNQWPSGLTTPISTTAIVQSSLIRCARTLPALEGCSNHCSLKKPSADVSTLSSLTPQPRPYRPYTATHPYNSTDLGAFLIRKASSLGNHASFLQHT